jgi:hypothetical protein
VGGERCFCRRKISSMAKDTKGATDLMVMNHRETDEDHEGDPVSKLTPRI